MRTIAGWSSPVARQAHNLKVGGSNPLPASALVVVRSVRLLEESFLDVAQVDGGLALCYPGSSLWVFSFLTRAT